ncbi:NAD(P)-binding protein [Gymnopus androsaceus JB14]|uniref:NAD(P)-binding protein n=1 Tax=Gymnopus androsaceus JB14 TaxID=1447944 RepID=A0A6A4GLM1_9AGAR|nr:NAD(P)-binding protein [Gymnopus androsaceus JB14]
MACSIKSRSSNKLLAYTKHDPSKLVIDLEKIDENENGTTFIHTSPPGITTTEGPGATCESSVFPDSPDIKDTEGRSVSDKYFLEKASENTLEIYQKIMWSAEQRYGPIMEVFKVEGSRKRRLVIGYEINGTSGHEGRNSLLILSPQKPVLSPKGPGSPGYLQLKNGLGSERPCRIRGVNNIKRRFREETFTRESIEQVIHTHSELLPELMPTLSYQRLQTIQPLSDEELYDKIRRTVPNKHSLQVLESFLIFNKHILKTNFYQPTKVTLSFRLDPGFSYPMVEYPKKPFAMFFEGSILGIRDVARGGIRIVMSRNKEMYSINQRMLFDENYNLASTQSLKNKDIPEGRCQGYDIAFDWGYSEAIVDLLIPGKTPGIKETPGRLMLIYVCHAEDTADMMDWAALHTHDRGAETWWKSLPLESVPRHSVEFHTTRMYVLGIYKQLGLKEKEITKVQTGGPDGDLGSNEIYSAPTKPIAIIDGSGVLADPTGLDREELVRLAKKRLTVAHFDRTKLSKDGYLVKVEEQDVKLPSGEIVLDGTDFRNGAHLRFKADLFVPCGGRPEAVNISHMAALFDSEGKSHFKYIVEGANLFLTQQARLFLEKRKVVVFKDSSTNKGLVGFISPLKCETYLMCVRPGGVTSSSLEVLAGLALSTEEYVDLMIFKDGKPSEFYQSYVKDIQEKITENAAAEFHCLWKEHTRLQGAKPRTTISDELSSTLNNLQAELESSDLFEDVPSRNGVMRRAIPKTLVEKIGLETLLKRLPEAYQRALFSSWVASHFLYKYGVNASSVDFFHFARDLSK